MTGDDPVSIAYQAIILPVELHGRVLEPSTSYDLVFSVYETDVLPIKLQRLKIWYP